MRQAILFAVFITATHFAEANPLFNTIRVSQINHKDSSGHTPITQQMLLDIMNVIGLQPNFELKEGKVLNIEASISHRQRYILYNPEFISRISAATGNKWAAIALLAHEVGHHLNGHTIKKTGSKPKLELEADEFAGFILYKLGASLQQAQEIMNYISTTPGSATHPAKASRLLAIQSGWNKAADIINSTSQKNAGSGNAALN